MRGAELRFLEAYRNTTEEIGRLRNEADEVFRPALVVCHDEAGSIVLVSAYFRIGCPAFYKEL